MQSEKNIKKSAHFQASSSHQGFKNTIASVHNPLLLSHQVRNEPFLSPHRCVCYACTYNSVCVSLRSSHESRSATCSLFHFRLYFRLRSFNFVEDHSLDCSDSLIFLHACLCTELWLCSFCLVFFDRVRLDAPTSLYVFTRIRKSYDSISVDCACMFSCNCYQLS